MIFALAILEHKGPPTPVAGVDGPFFMVVLSASAAGRTGRLTHQALGQHAPRAQRGAVEAVALGLS